MRYSINIVILSIFLISCVASQNKYTLQSCTSDSSKSTCNYQYNAEAGYNQVQVDDAKVNKNLTLEIIPRGNGLTAGIVQVRLINTDGPRYEVPRFILSDEFEHPLVNYAYNNTFTKDINYITIKDPRTDEDLFTLFKNELMYADDYISFDYGFPSDYIFGYGERATRFKLPKGIYTIWPNDTGVGSIEDDGLGGKNLYGHEPFMMIRKPPSDVHLADSYIGVLFLNSNPQELEVKGNGEVRQITLGGIVEIFAWSRSTPIETIKVFHHIIGKPVLPPYWALGWHQSRYGYRNTSHIKSVIDNYIQHQIPLDTIWADIDYMSQFQDFSVDDSNFGDLPDLIRKVQKENGIHFVPILDIGIPNDPENFYYKVGVESNSFMMSNYTKKPLVNKVWPGECVFPDYTNYQNASKLWEYGLENFTKIVDYDGLWLDMNEPGTFVEGEILKEGDKDEANNIYSNLTYVPGMNFTTLTSHGISLNALFTSNAPFNTVLNLKVVNTFLQNKITHEYLKKEQKRPFILSRSNFIGMGRYSNHWLGDNHSTYVSMKASISGIFNFQMFGYNLVGADICGFLQDTNDKLCARWSTLGAFYPFSRNHNNLGQVDQEPWSLGALTLKSSMRAILMRYSIMRYLYTQHYFSSLEGGVVFQPLFFQFPNVKETLENESAMNYQIMIGPALLFSPALQESEDAFPAVFPSANWNAFPSGDVFLSAKDFKNKNDAKTMPLSGSYDEIHMLMRGGHIIPLQDVWKYKVLTTSDLQKLPICIVINPDENEYAVGDIIYDDPSSDPEETLTKKRYLHVKVEMKDLTSGIKFTVVNHFNYNKIDVLVEKIVIFKNGSLNEAKLNESFIKKIRFLSGDMTFDNRENLISISFYEPTPINKLGNIDLF